MSKSLGGLEEAVLLLVAANHQEAYGFTISEAYSEHYGSRISISAVHTVLNRLEKKGLIRSELGGATPERGGRRKRMFKVTTIGMTVLEESQVRRTRLWGMVPKVNFSV